MLSGLVLNRDYLLPEHSVLLILSTKMAKGWVDPDGIWTRDLLIQSSALYRMSYPAITYTG